MSATPLHANQIELLKFVPEPLRTEIARRMHPKKAQKGQTILQEGTHSFDVFFLLEGQAEVLLYEPDDGDTVFVNVIGAGDLVGEIAALDRTFRSASVVAYSDVRYAIMTASDFNACIESSPAAATWLARRLASSVRRLTDKVFELSALTVPMRICRELFRLSEKGSMRNGFIEVADLPTHGILASRASTHREAVTRELGVLKKEKIVDYEDDGRVLKILNLPRLQREARL